MDNRKRLLQDEAALSEWLESLVRQIGVVPDMPFNELLQFESFFGIQMLDTSGEPLLLPHANFLQRYPVDRCPFRFRVKWPSDKRPKSYPCIAVPWFERRGNLDIFTVSYVYPADFAAA